MMARLRADFMLFVAAAIWGTAFVAQKEAAENMGPMLFVGCRFVLSALLLLPVALWENRRLGDAPLTGGDWRLGLGVGLCLFLGLGGQQVGIMTTTATNAGFLTALYVVMVPAAAWLLSRERPRLSVIAACCVSLLGACLLEQRGGEQRWALGDLWIVLSDAVQALQILLVTRFLGRTNRPYFLSFLQYAVTAGLAWILALAFEPISWSAITATLPAILFAGIMSGGIAFTLQIVAQRHTPAAEAAIIMSLESVFAALAGAWLLGDRLSALGIVGCGLILLGVVLVQLVPLWRRGVAPAE